MSTIDTAVIKRQDFPTMVQSYQSAMAKIDQAFTLFQEASDLLTAAFGGHNFNVAQELVYHRGQDDVKLQLRKNAWRSVLDRLEIEKVMSNKQLDETEKRFQDGKNIPEITLDTLKEISFGLLEKAPEYANELFKEAYKFLMTGNNQWDHYKTNEKNARRSLGKKVILRWIVESSF
ncbi:MAG: DUF4942 domain-containing protein, partial [Sphaerochaeta sp.]|nr:DUF4942 domain-containing protein [Sphaerochaeta sp.]